MEQKLAEKGLDNIVRETHIYKGPQGEGFINYEYKMNGTQLQVKAEHTGPEARVLPTTWTTIDDVVEIRKQEVGSEFKEIDEVIEVIDPLDPTKKTKKVGRVTVQVPIYGDVEVTVKHPYKDTFFGGKK